MLMGYSVKLKILYNSIKGKICKIEKVELLEINVTLKSLKKPKNYHLGRDKELDSLREKQKKDDELQKDGFDIAVELSGLGS